MLISFMRLVMRKILPVLLIFTLPVSGQYFKINKRYVDSLKSVLTSENDQFKICTIYNSISKEFLKIFQCDSIKLYSNKALKIALKNGYKNLEGLSYKFISMAARYSYDTTNYADQRTIYFSNINKAIDAFSHTNNFKELSESYGFLGQYYLKYWLEGPIYDHYQKALAAANKSNDLQALGLIYYRFGEYYNRTGDQYKSVDYFEKSDSIFKSIKDTMNIVMLLGRQAMTQYTLKSYDKQLQLMEKCWSLVKGGDNALLIADVLHDYSIALINNRKYDDAIKYLKISIKSAKEVNSFSLLSSIYNQLSIAYESKRDYARALENLKLSSVYLFSHNSRLNNESANMQKYLINLEKESYELKIHQNEIEKRLIILAAAVIIIALILLFVLYVNKNKKKSNLLLEEKNRLIVDQNIELEQLNKELESFCYSVSHDLKAPLRGINGFSNALAEDHREHLNDDAKFYIDKINNSTSKMSQLIESLLDLSRITLHNLKKEKVILSEIVHQICDDLKTYNPDRKIDFLITPGISAKCDRDFITIALENLLSNAVKYTANTPESIIEFGIIDDKENNKCYYVKDNGVGYDSKYANKLFQPFQRLHTVEEYPGTGVGLATVKRIIAKHGGSIWSESELGKGAVFYFTL